MVNGDISTTSSGKITWKMEYIAHYLLQAIILPLCLEVKDTVHNLIPETFVGPTTPQVNFLYLMCRN